MKAKGRAFILDSEEYARMKSYPSLIEEESKEDTESNYSKDGRLKQKETFNLY